MADDGLLTTYIARIKEFQRDLLKLAPPSDTERDVPVQTGDPAQSPTVFISWAHANAGWSREEAGAWQEDVATFAATIRTFGVDADVDLFHLEEATDWTRYGPTAIVDNDLTLVVMSVAWAERWSGKNSPTVGAGAAAEADTLHGLFAQNQARWQRRLVIVMLPSVFDEVIPPDLHRVARVYVNPENPDDYEGLLRLLTNQPSYPKLPLGRTPKLSPVASSASVEELQRQLSEVQRQDKDADATGTDGSEMRRKLELHEATLRAFIDVARQADGPD